MKRTKKIAVFALAASLAVSSACFSALAEDDAVKVVINGEELVIPEGDTQPFIENERTLVPMRAIFQALGAQVMWDEETRTVISYDPISDVSITLQIGDNHIFVGEEQIELDTPAMIVNDRTVVPVRAIAEGMHSVVDWDNATRTVIITKDLTGSAASPAQIANPWSEFKTLDELNAEIQKADGVKYSVADPSDPATVKENGYRYLKSSNMAEIQGTWDVGEGGELTIRTIPGAVSDPSEISGIYGAEKIEDYALENGGTVSVYRLDENTVYAVWSDDGLTHSVSVTASGWDPVGTVKTLVDDVEGHYPKG